MKTIRKLNDIITIDELSDSKNMGVLMLSCMDGSEKREEKKKKRKKRKENTETQKPCQLFIIKSNK
jgi:hypothetical protein